MQAFWFGVIAVLWGGFFLLEGFDFGVGVLLAFVARDDADRDVALRAIGPVWDGNEVWLLVAGGATFAAFPEWYASLFSGFYMAFALLLVGLILRGIGIEYRGKVVSKAGRRWSEAIFVGGSAVPALLVGVAFADILRGVDMNADHNVTSGFFSLLNPYALLGGLVSLMVFTLHGAIYLQLRTSGPVRDRAKTLVRPVGLAAVVLTVGFVLWSSHNNPLTDTIAALIAITLSASIGLAVRSSDGRAFACTALATLLLPIWTFAALWPDVLPARNNPAWSLTVHNASSSPYTLKVMTVVALVMTPIVLAYQAWSYWIFRARVTGGGAGDYTTGHHTIDSVIERAKRSAETTLGTAIARPAEERPTREQSTGPYA